MASETISAGLGKYGIGSKLRRLRLRKSMGLVELGKHTGLSPALLSKLERDLMHPTLPTLLRIAMVFSVGLEYFFNAEPRPVLAIVRKKDRLRFPDSPDARNPAYHFESLDFPVPNRALNSYLADFEPVAEESARMHEHPGIELLYLLSGKLELRVAEDIHMLFGRRFDLFRFVGSAWISASGAEAHRRAGGDAGPARLRNQSRSRSSRVSRIRRPRACSGSEKL